MRQALDLVNAPTQALLGHPLIGTGAAASATAFIMGATLNPQPAPSYVTAINNAHIQSNPAYAGFNPFGLYTPEGASIPFISGLTLDQSVVQGQMIPNNAIMGRPAGSHTLVFGYSQSAAIATLEMRALDALPADQRPSPGDLSFMLIGNLDNPNGGLFSRFTVNIPILDIPFHGATPSDTPYPTTIYSGQYDGVAILAELNALAGTVYAHPQYAHFTPEQAGSDGARQLGLQPERVCRCAHRRAAVARLQPSARPLKWAQPQLNDLGVYLPTYPAVSPNPQSIAWPP